MQLTNLQLIYFRNFDTLSLTFDSKINIFLGENGVGKTNILEAIALLSIPKSFRTKDKDQLIKNKKDHFIVKGGFDNDQIIEIGYQSSPSKRTSLKINDVKQSTENFLKGVHIITFTPQDMHLLDLGPSKRREYINRILSKLDFFYLDNLSKYEKIIRRRNALLKGINEGQADKSMIEIWDSQLITAGAYLIQKRIELIQTINNNIQYQEISKTQETAHLNYASKIHKIINTPFDINKKYTLVEIEKLFLNALNTRLNKDILLKATSVGPHRDDVKFYLNEHDIENFASRGEKRTMLLALKITELEIVKNNTKNPPILLLDDVFSELDNNRQTQLLNLISQYQTFITTNAPEHFANFTTNKTIWNVMENGVFKAV